MPRAVTPLALLAIIAGCAQTPDATDPAALQLPAYPVEANLVEFTVSERDSGRFLVDSTSMSIDPVHETRLTLVVRSANNVDTVTYEAVRCQTGEFRIYAIGRRDGSWSQLRDAPWRHISDARGFRHRAVLAAEYLCEGPASVLTAEKVIAAMRNPDHMLQGVQNAP